MKITGKKNVLGMWTAMKGLLVILVVLVHSAQATGDLLGTQVYPIPFRALAKAGAVVLFTFFMINGYLYKSGKTNKKIREQFLSYLKIYGITMAVLIVTEIFRDILLSRPWKEAVILLAAGGIYGAGRSTYLFGYKLTPPYAMWFFVTLMYANLLLNLFMKLKNEKIKKAAILGIPVIYFALNAVFGHSMVEFLWKLPFFPSATLLTVPLLYIGYLLKRSNILFEEIPVKGKLLVLALALISFFFGQIDMEMGEYRLQLLDYVGAICGSLVFLYLYLLIVNPEWRILDPLMWIGRRSLWLIPLHCIEGILFSWEEMYSLGNLGFYLSTAVIFVLRWAVLVVFCIVLEKAISYAKRWSMIKQMK